MSHFDHYIFFLKCSKAVYHFIKKKRNSTFSPLILIYCNVRKYEFDIMVYRSVFKYKSYDIKFVWSNLQIIRLSANQRLTSLNLMLCVNLTK